MEYIFSMLIGLLQGLTEFLPVSSSGHLVLSQHLLHIKQDSLVLEVVLHLGTALAILFVYRLDVSQLVKAGFGTDSEKKWASWNLLGLLIVGSIPAGFVGIFFKDFFEEVFMQPRISGFMLIITAGLLFLSRWHTEKGRIITYGSALVIGLAQAFAIFPGISRSGSTIVAALMLGLARKEAGRFSFYLALPAIFGAALLQIKDISEVVLPLGAILSGFLVSFISGVIALKILLRFVEKGQLHYFAYYCLPVGVAAVLFF